VQSAVRHGHRAIEPPVLRGKLSGIVHKFSLLVSMEGRFCAFDIYGSVGIMDVLKTRVKVLDTEASGYIVSSSSNITPGAREIAWRYGISLATANEIELPQKIAK